MNLINNFQLTDHPSDVGIKANANSPEKLFEICAEGMFSIMCKIDDVKPAIEKKVKIFEAENIPLEDMLVYWLEKLLYLHEVEKMLFSCFKIDYIKINNRFSSLEGSVYGENIDFKKHKFFISIKAPTYHMLKARKDDSGKFWVAEVIFDV